MRSPNSWIFVEVLARFGYDNLDAYTNEKKERGSAAITRHPLPASVHPGVVLRREILPDLAPEHVADVRARAPRAPAFRGGAVPHGEAPRSDADRRRRVRIVSVSGFCRDLPR